MNLLFTRAALRELYTDSLINLASIDDMPPAQMCLAECRTFTESKSID